MMPTTMTDPLVLTPYAETRCSNPRGLYKHTAHMPRFHKLPYVSPWLQVQSPRLRVQIAAEFASLRTGAAGALSERTELEPTAFPAYAVDGGPASILVGCESMASLYPRLPRRRTHPLQCLVWCFSLHLHALQQ